MTLLWDEQEVDSDEQYGRQWLYKVSDFLPKNEAAADKVQVSDWPGFGECLLAIARVVDLADADLQTVAEGGERMNRVFKSKT